MYAIKYLDRKGREYVLPERFTDPKQANQRILELAGISAKRIHGKTGSNVYHRTGNSIVRYSDWQSDFEEYWRISV